MDLFFRKYFWVVNLTAIGLCAALVGRAASHVAEAAYLSSADDAKVPGVRRNSMPTAPKTHGKETEDIVRRDVFCSGCVPVVKEADKTSTPGASSNEPQKTTLQLELVSTMVSDDEAWSMAVLRDLASREKDAEMFNRGKKVFSTGATVKSVHSRRVYLDHDGRVEYLDLDSTPPAAATPATPAPAVAPPPAAGNEFGDLDKSIQCNGGNCTIERALVEKALGNLSGLANLARFVPSMRDGKPNGFKVYAIRPNSLFGKIGLQNGDTIKQINGNEMSTPDQALSLFTKLRSASHLTMQVERRSETVSMDYTIK
jgi:general secretion pathway protein C